MRSGRGAGPRPLVEGALLAALTVVLALIALYVPVLGVAVAYTWAIPVMIIHIRHGARLAALTVAAATVLLAVYAGPVEALTRAVYIGLIGLAFGHAFRRRMTATSAILIGSLGGMAVTIAQGALLLVFLGRNPVSFIRTMYNESLTRTQALYERFGYVDQQVVREFVASWQLVLANLELLVPMLVVGAGLVIALINYLVAGAILPRLGYRVEPIPAFADWRISPEAVYAGTLVAAIGLWGANRPEAPGWLVSGLRATGFSLGMLTVQAVLLQGLVIIYSFMAHQGVPRALRVLVTALAVSVPPVWLVAVLGGLVDPVLDIRRLWRRSDK
jgi:uncharacterized protein YybS (DUF2232 family)